MVRVRLDASASVVRMVCFIAREMGQACFLGNFDEAHSTRFYSPEINVSCRDSGQLRETTSTSAKQGTVGLEEEIRGWGQSQLKIRVTPRRSQEILREK